MQSARRLSKTELLAFVIALAAGLFLSLQGWKTVFWNGQVHPLDYDSFYHMTRALEAAADPGSTHEFDARLHWPHGAWVPWPWAYDYLVGVTAGLFASDALGTARVAAFTPTLFLAVNLALFGLVARSVLQPRMVAIAVVAFAVAPLTLTIHKLGRVDHHIAEQAFWLLGLLLTVRWFREPASVRASALLGCVLGLATGFHNGLFILQIPVLLALLGGRLTGQGQPSARAVAGFIIALLGAQTLVLLPSHHFQDLTYRFYHLSWFHLHVAVLTSLAAWAIARPGARAMWLLLGLGVALALPALPQALEGLNFLGQKYAALEQIREANSPFWGRLSWREVTNFYSGLLWLTPVALLWCAWRLATRQARGAEWVVQVFSLIGLTLLTLQVRFHYYGSPHLLLLPLLALQTYFRPPREAAYAVILLAGAYFQSIATYAATQGIGAGERYSMGWPLIAAFIEPCRRQPGLLLADRNWANYLRYQTGCSLIANNFIVNEADFEAIRRTDHLLSLNPGQLLEEEPQLRYVLVALSEKNALSRSLLTNEIDPRFELLAEIHDARGGILGRSFRVRPAPPANHGPGR